MQPERTGRGGSRRQLREDFDERERPVEAFALDVIRRLFVIVERQRGVSATAESVAIAVATAATMAEMIAAGVMRSGLA